MKTDIKLNEWGLPEGVQPHNPAGLNAEVITEGGKYRAVTVNESASQENVAECFDEVQAKWIKAAPFFKGTSFGVLSLTYRLPASVPFPDWEEMSRATVKESLTAQPAPEYHSWVTQPDANAIAAVKHAETLSRAFAEDDVKRITEDQPAPGETPETIKAVNRAREICGGNESAMLAHLVKHARTLERQRDQAREELATENADRVRLREALEDMIDDRASLPGKPRWEAYAKARKALSTPPPEMVSKAEHDALKKRFDELETEKLYGMQELNARLIDRTTGMLDGQVRMQQMPSVKSFRAGFKAGCNYIDPTEPGEEESLRLYMAENEPKGMTLAELKGGEE